MGHEKHDLSVSQWTSKDVESQCTLEMEHTFGIINVALRYTEEEQDHHSIHGQEEGWECGRRGAIRKTESRFPSFMQSSKYLQGTRVPSAFYCADHLMWILLSNCQRSSHSFSGTTHLRQTFPLLLPIDVWSDLTSQGLSSFICRMAAVTMSSLGGSASYRLACSGDVHGKNRGACPDFFPPSSCAIPQQIQLAWPWPFSASLSSCLRRHLSPGLSQ